MKKGKKQEETHGPALLAGELVVLATMPRRILPSNISTSLISSLLVSTAGSSRPRGIGVASTLEETMRVGLGRGWADILLLLLCSWAVCRWGNNVCLREKKWYEIMR